MNAKNNLQNALKEAFENHEEPLKEAQWERLEGVLISNKPKRRFYPFIFTLLLVGLTAGVTYILTLNYALDSRTPQTLIQKPEQFIEQTTRPEINSQRPIEKSKERFISKIKYALVNLNKKGQSKQGVILAMDASDSPAIIEDNNNTGETENITAPVSANTETENPYSDEEDLALSDAEPVKAEETNIKKDIGLQKDDKPKKSKDDKELENTSNKKPHSKLVISLASGYSKMNVKVTGLENESKLHKDTRTLFEQSNKNLKTVFFNLGFDYPILPGFNIGLNSGIQYLKITTPVDIKYEYAEIPFRDIDRSITGYYTPSNVKELNANTNNTTTYINVPLRFNYTFPINFKNEILLTGGANFNAIVSAKGKTVTVEDDAQVKTLEKNRYSQLSTGFLGGLQYSHRLKGPWWIAAEGQYLSNKMRFKLGYGSINANLSGYRLNFVLKYKM